MDKKILMAVLEKIAANPDLLNGKWFTDVLGPNINMVVMDKGVFWNNIAEYNGWKIQQNTITHHCRIIDPNKIRRAWGGMSAMEEIFEKIANHN